MSSTVSALLQFSCTYVGAELTSGILEEGRARRAVAERSRPFLRRAGAGALSVGWAFSTCVGIGSNKNFDLVNQKGLLSGEVDEENER